MKKGVFITGTDTGIGKTYVAAGIARSLVRMGVNAGVMKPVETGCRRQAGRLIPRDAMQLMKASNARDALALINPYRFQKPLAPLVAAEFEGAQIRTGKIVKAYHELARKHEFMIIEGAGGIMVPLQQNYTYRELARDMGLPVLIVARPGLGTINHTLLTVASLNEKGLDIAGIVINHARRGKTGLAEKTNPVLIEKMCGVAILGILSYREHRFETIAEQLK
ncbi:MAG TPA: dethiobiotin synthase [Nitrospirota bacterium]|nr:dethiobiotin synthase [Nitrospirota bacterium]